MHFKIVDNIDMNKDYTLEDLDPIGVRNFTATKSEVAQGKSANGRPYYPTIGYEYFDTKAGKIELSKWIILIERAIEAAGLSGLYERIKRYSKEKLFWIRTDEDMRIHSAECLLNKAYEHWEDF